MKPRFLTSLQAKWVGDGKRELTTDLVYLTEIVPNLIIVPAGFQTDLASVPRLPITYLFFGNVADEAAVVHDYLYTSDVEGITRREADAIFAEASKVLGVKGWRRGPMWLAVRVFGKGHWGSGSPLKTEPDL